MDILKIVLIIVLASVGGGCLIGVLSGKHAVKKATNPSRALLTIKERIIYTVMIIAGATCILAGIFLVSPSNNQDMVNPGFDDGYYEGDDAYMDDENVMVYGGDVGDEEEDGEENTDINDEGLADADNAEGTNDTDTETETPNRSGGSEVIIVGENGGMAILG